MTHLKEVRKSAGLSQKEVAIHIGVKQNTYSYWENGKSRMNSESLAKLAKLFGVTTDYLLNDTQNKSATNEELDDCQLVEHQLYKIPNEREKIMSNRLKELCSSVGLTQKELATFLGVAQPTLSGWESGRFQIDYDSLIKIADYFNTSIDYLLGRDLKHSSLQNNIPGNHAVRSDEEKLLDVYNSLNDHYKAKFMSVAYLLATINLANENIDLNTLVEQQLNKNYNK